MFVLYLAECLQAFEVFLNIFTLESGAIIAGISQI